MAPFLRYRNLCDRIKTFEIFRKCKTRQLESYHIQMRAETANDHVCPRFSSCSFSCRQTPVRLAAIRFPGRFLTGQAPPRPPQPPPPPPPSAVPLTRIDSWRAAGRSWTQRWGCTALPTLLRPPPARITPITSPTAQIHPLSTPLWWAHFTLISWQGGGWEAFILIDHGGFSLSIYLIVPTCRSRQAVSFSVLSNLFPFANKYKIGLHQWHRPVLFFFPNNLIAHPSSFYILKVLRWTTLLKRAVQIIIIFYIWYWWD